MVNLESFTKANLTYIKPKEVIEHPEAVFVITSEPTLVEGDYEGKKSVRVHCEGEWNKEKRSIDLSKTNSRIISGILGNETKSWIGHQLIFEVYKFRDRITNKLTDAINVKEVK